eukprot:5177747-Alexandrium_andersonii.AAC.1
MLPLFCPLAFLGFASVVGLYVRFLYWPIVAVAVAASLALPPPLPALVRAPLSILLPLVPAAPPVTPLAQDLGRVASGSGTRPGSGGPL